MPNRTNESPYRMSRPPVARNECNFVLYSSVSACEPDLSGHAKMIPLDADVNKTPLSSHCNEFVMLRHLLAEEYATDNGVSEILHPSHFKDCRPNLFV